MNIEIKMTDDIGTELGSFTLGKKEGEWNPECAEEMGQLIREIERIWNDRKKEREE